MRRPAHGHGLGFCVDSALDSSHLALSAHALALQSVNPDFLRALPIHHARSWLGAPSAPAAGAPIHRVLIYHGL